MNASPSVVPRDPLLSFGIPVRNAEKYLSRLLDSLLAQDFSDFEIVISDNDSTDRTGEICQNYAQQDTRVRYHRNPENIGQNANFNRVLELAYGKYFRWIGWDDWLEPDYARRCVAALEARPDAIGVTTYQDFTDEDGGRDYAEYTGKRLDSPHPHVRYERMLWFMTADFRFMDPVYTMMRRDILLKSGRTNQPVIAADQVLAVELGLWGPFIHVPACLAHRGKTPFEKIPAEEILKQYYNEQYDQVKKQTFWDLAAAFWAPVNKLHLNPWQKFLCLFPLIRFIWIVISRITQERLRPVLRPLKLLVLRSGKTIRV